MALDHAGYPTSMGFRNIAFLIVPLVVKWLFFISLLTSRIWLESPVIWHFSYVGWGHFPCEASSKSTDSSFRTLSWHPELKSGHLSWKEPWRPKHNRPQTELNIYPMRPTCPNQKVFMWCWCDQSVVAPLRSKVWEARLLFITPTTGWLRFVDSTLFVSFPSSASPSPLPSFNILWHLLQ